jgi:hypothetical protein
VRDYPQANPPSPITCAVYFLVALVMLGVVTWIVAKGAGLI